MPILAHVTDKQTNKKMPTKASFGTINKSNDKKEIKNPKNKHTKKKHRQRK